MKLLGIFCRKPWTPPGRRADWWRCVPIKLTSADISESKSSDVAEELPRGVEEADFIQVKKQESQESHLKDVISNLSSRNLRKPCVLMLLDKDLLTSQDLAAKAKEMVAFALFSLERLDSRIRLVLTGEASAAVKDQDMIVTKESLEAILKVDVQQPGWRQAYNTTIEMKCNFALRVTHRPPAWFSTEALNALKKQTVGGELLLGRVFLSARSTSIATTSAGEVKSG